MKIRSHAISRFGLLTLVCRHFFMFVFFKIVCRVGEVCAKASKKRARLSTSDTNLTNDRWTRPAYPCIKGTHLILGASEYLFVDNKNWVFGSQSRTTLIIHNLMQRTHVCIILVCSEAGVTVLYYLQDTFCVVIDTMFIPSTHYCRWDTRPCQWQHKTWMMGSTIQWHHINMVHTCVRCIKLRIMSVLLLRDTNTQFLLSTFHLVNLPK